MHHLGILVCSRGVVYARAWRSWLEADWPETPHYVVEHAKPIPWAQIAVTERALAQGYEWLLYLEEDIVIPPELPRRFDPELPVQTVDYPLGGGNRSVTLDDQGKVLYSGMGCLLVRADVFQTLAKPWFDTVIYKLEHPGRLVKGGEKAARGGQDVYFCANLAEHGWEIRLVSEIECRHLEMVALGSASSNHGLHLIRFRK